MEVLISTLYMMKRFNVMHILLNNNFEKGTSVSDPKW